MFSAVLLVYCSIFIHVLSKGNRKARKVAKINSRIRSKKLQNDDNYSNVYKKIPELPKEFLDEDWHHESKILERTEDCEKYFENVPIFGMNKEIIRYEDQVLKFKNISLAFSHMLHQQVAIYEVFLAMYFRPNNFYCIHVDVKASETIRNTVERLVKCYATKTTTGKIFVIEKSESLNVS